MHETALVNDLISKLKNLAREHGVKKFMNIHVRLGSLCHFTAPHFKQHFLAAAEGTPAQWAKLEVETSDNILDIHAREVVLVSVEIET